MLHAAHISQLMVAVSPPGALNSNGEALTAASSSSARSLRTILIGQSDECGYGTAEAEGVLAGLVLDALS